MARPVVGIPTPVETARWSRVWEADCAIVSMSYVGAVQRAGGLALLLPPDAQATRDPSEVVEHIDALLLAGWA